MGRLFDVISSVKIVIVVGWNLVVDDETGLLQSKNPVTNDAAKTFRFLKHFTKNGNAQG